MLLCFLAAADLVCNNFFSLLEGINISRLYIFTASAEALLPPLTLWFFLSRGYGLYALPLSLAAAITFLLLLSAGVPPAFCPVLLQGKAPRRQYFMAAGNPASAVPAGNLHIAGFIQYSLFVPISFRFVGPVAAGQMGLSWTLSTP